MSNNIDGGPAFPRPATAFATPSGMAGDRGETGMTIRDYFAAKALAGLLAGDAHQDVVLHTLMDDDGKILRRAEFAYKLADAMLAARNAGAA
jgi:hypothetical protein